MVLSQQQEEEEEEEGSVRDRRRARGIDKWLAKGRNKAQVRLTVSSVRESSFVRCSFAACCCCLLSSRRRYTFLYLLVPVPSSSTFRAGFRGAPATFFFRKPRAALHPPPSYTVSRSTCKKRRVRITSQTVFSDKLTHCQVVTGSRSKSRDLEHLHFVLQ
jgi:hypothetical protein